MENLNTELCLDCQHKLETLQHVVVTVELLQDCIQTLDGNSECIIALDGNRQILKGLFGERDPRDRISELIQAGNRLVDEKRAWKRKYEAASILIKQYETET